MKLFKAISDFRKWKKSQYKFALRDAVDNIPYCGSVSDDKY